MSDEPLILVCAPVVRRRLLMADNVTGRCASCDIEVQYRPHAPTPHVLRCVDCAIKMAEPGDELPTTKRMLQDWRAYIRKSSH
ncbi:hypothetical protein [Bradyrhizobium ottawaense]|uniref:hypothetical protein n=1 Tax=Bradyrhizobium ottawaense TaxID=931866 RepID=UPI0030F486EB